MLNKRLDTRQSEKAKTERVHVKERETFDDAPSVGRHCVPAAVPHIRVCDTGSICLFSLRHGSSANAINDETVAWLGGAVTHVLLMSSGSRNLL